ncbi:hypothetical protein [Mesorhizobium sp. CN2-181]|uniref:hypothetical protein n=1 Tax=Mesorhizobium yinganensis TaxID=3157707 RepID=UPI0032B7477B
MSYRAYAGIGSRETPDVILQWMTHIAGYLANEGWTLRSGGAPGADKAFEAGVQDLRLKEIYLPWPGFEGSKSTLHPKNFPFTVKETATAFKAHPAWDRCSEGAKALHTRNVRQIWGIDRERNHELSKFVVCWTDRGLLKGGTAQALRIAMDNNVRIFNLGKATSDAELKVLLVEMDEFQKGIS